MMDQIQERLLAEVADLHGVPEGAYNIRCLLYTSPSPRD